MTTQEFKVLLPRWNLKSENWFTFLMQSICPVENKASGLQLSYQAQMHFGAINISGQRTLIWNVIYVI